MDLSVNRTDADWNTGRIALPVENLHRHTRAVEIELVLSSRYRWCAVTGDSDGSGHRNGNIHLDNVDAAAGPCDNRRFDTAP